MACDQAIPGRSITSIARKPIYMPAKQAMCVLERNICKTSADLRFDVQMHLENVMNDATKFAG